MRYLAVIILIIILASCSTMQTHTLLAGYVVAKNIKIYTESGVEELKTGEDISSFENFESFEEK